MSRERRRYRDVDLVSRSPPWNPAERVDATLDMGNMFLM